MTDYVFKGMTADIKRLAEKKLGRRLSKTEIEKVSIPRSYLAMEAIIDYLRDDQLDASAVEVYLNQL